MKRMGEGKCEKCMTVDCECSMKLCKANSLYSMSVVCVCAWLGKKSTLRQNVCLSEQIDEAQVSISNLCVCVFVLLSHVH